MRRSKRVKEEREEKKRVKTEGRDNILIFIYTQNFLTNNDQDVVDTLI